MITVHEYSLPFKSEFQSASGRYSHREGLILTYTHPALGFFSTEAAPLPGFSPESYNELRSESETIVKDFHSLLTPHTEIADLNTYLTQIEPLPSLQFALSLIGLFHLSGFNKGPDWFPRFTSPKKELQINDVIGIMGEQEFHHAITESIEQGFRTIKVKCSYPFGYIPRMLRHYSEKYPGLRFRVDANQSWPVRALEEFPDAFTNVRLEYIEEPCRNTQSILYQYPDLPVAYDESIQGIKGLDSLLSLSPDRYIVIKPALFGNIFALAETILKYRSTGNRVVFSTLLESAIGRSLILLLATTLGDHDLAHGLHTGKFFGRDLIQSGNSLSEPPSASFFPENSILHIPDNEHMKTLFTIY